MREASVTDRSATQVWGTSWPTFALARRPLGRATQLGAKGHETQPRQAQARRTAPSLLLLGIALLLFCDGFSARTLVAQEAEAPPVQISNSQWKGGYNGLAMLCRLTGANVHSSMQEWASVPPS